MMLKMDFLILLVLITSTLANRIVKEMESNGKQKSTSGDWKQLRHEIEELFGSEQDRIEQSGTIEELEISLSHKIHILTLLEKLHKTYNVIIESDENFYAEFNSYYEALQLTLDEMKVADTTLLNDIKNHLKVLQEKLTKKMKNDTEAEIRHSASKSIWQKLKDDFGKLADGIKEDWDKVKHVGAEVVRTWKKDLNDVEKKTVELFKQAEASFMATMHGGKGQYGEFDKFYNEIHKTWNDLNSTSKNTFNDIKTTLEKIKRKLEKKKKHHYLIEGLALEAGVELVAP